MLDKQQTKHVKAQLEIGNTPLLISRSVDQREADGKAACGGHSRSSLLLPP